MARPKKEQSNKSPQSQRKNGPEAARPIVAESSVLRGVYANFTLIRHGPDDFILDFMLQTPESVNLVSRVITNASHMKRLAQAINENIKKYEATYGTIPKQPQKAIPPP